jgi:hypothetical protein
MEVSEREGGTRKVLQLEFRGGTDVVSPEGRYFYQKKKKKKVLSFPGYNNIT